jgi:hypothetical protein
MELVGTGSNLLEPVQTGLNVCNMSDLLKSGWPTPVGTGLEAASTGRNWLDPDTSGWTRMDADGTGLYQIKHL